MDNLPIDSEPLYDTNFVSDFELFYHQVWSYFYTILPTNSEPFIILSPRSKLFLHTPSYYPDRNYAYTTKPTNSNPFWQEIRKERTILSKKSGAGAVLLNISQNKLCIFFRKSRISLKKSSIKWKKLRIS